MNRKKPRPACKAGCGKHVSRPTYSYCSVKCQQALRRRNLAARFMRGEYPPTPYCGLYFVKRYLIETLGERCARCGWCERHATTERVPLELEHIDGDWKNTRPENLTLLCPNCHALTLTFKALNKGRGRELRQKKRRELRDRADVA